MLVQLQQVSRHGPGCESSVNADNSQHEDYCSILLIVIDEVSSAR